MNSYRSHRRSKGFILDWPTGSGKTQGVYSRIFYGTAKRKSLALKRVSQTLIILPNRGMKKAWLRELGIFYIRIGIISKSEEEFKSSKSKKEMELLWRSWGAEKQKNFLRKYSMSSPAFDTYTRLFKMSRRPPRALQDRVCRYLILDEWHRIGLRQRHKILTEFQDNKLKKAWWNLLHESNRLIRRDIFFCSATPLNPASEEREESVTGSDEKFESSLRAELQRVASIVSVLSGQPNIDVEFWKDIHRPGKAQILPIYKKSKSLWRPPEDTGNHFNEALEKTIRIPFIRRLLSEFRSKEITIIEELMKKRTSFSIEYNFSTGLVATKSGRKRIHYLSPIQKKSFGLDYEKPFLAVERVSGIRATSWLLKEQGRIFRLLILLHAFGIIELSSKSIVRGVPFSFRLLPSKKVLIFTHFQAVAKGLKSSLTLICSNIDSSELIRSNLEFSGKKARKRRNGVIHDFDQSNEPQLLIATDALSESYDLHGRCQTVIHYELPWTPYRLFQRVGRITRILASEKKCQLGYVGHVMIPGSAEEERVNRLIRRIQLLSKHQLLPGIRRQDWGDSRKSVARYIGLGPSLHLQEYLASGKSYAIVRRKFGR